MKMKKWILLLIFFLTVQIVYKIAPVLAQDNKEYIEIKNVIDKFIKYNALRDVNSAMNLVSVNYSSMRRDNSIVDYAKFKAALEKNIAISSKKYTGTSLTYVKILESDIQDNNKATLKIEYGWKGFNLEAIKEETGKVRRSVSLVKENGIWKITQWIQLPQSK